LPKTENVVRPLNNFSFAVLPDSFERSGMNFVQEIQLISLDENGL